MWLFFGTDGCYVATDSHTSPKKLATQTHFAS